MNYPIEVIGIECPDGSLEISHISNAPYVFGTNRASDMRFLLTKGQKSVRLRIVRADEPAAKPVSRQEFEKLRACVEDLARMVHADAWENNKTQVAIDAHNLVARIAGISKS